MTHTTQKTKVSVADLRVGMYVCELDRPWAESPFLFQGFEMKTEADIRAVRKICRYVYIDISREMYAPPSLKKANLIAAQKEEAPPPRARPRVQIEQEIHAARCAYENTSALVRTMMDDIHFGRRIDTQGAKQVVRECVDSLIRNPDALLFLTQLKNRDEYTAQHSLNVCIYSVAFGIRLGYQGQTLEDLGLSGLMHDMGKMKVPLEVLNKPGKLTVQEFEIMKQHTTLGRDILMSARESLPSAVDVAYSHHERLNGSGYPLGLDGEHLAPFSKIVAIVDTYDAITSDRVYHNSRTHMDAINVLSKSRGKGFDSRLVIKFIERIGIYPPGTVVEMGNGEVGVVMEVYPKAKIRPKVVLILDERKRPRAPRLVDLSKLDLDAAAQPYVIRKVLTNNAYGINLTRFNRERILEKAAAEAAHTNVVEQARVEMGGSVH
jgi:HD-GYP domain-containing protein (c-di-GMP phosphodiesterase class II)